MADKKRHPDQISDEDKEKLFEHFENGSTYEKILEDDDVDVGSTTTIKKYKEEWIEDKELESQIHERELTPETFKKEIEDVPKMGTKKRNFAYKLAKLDPSALRDPNKVYRILKKAKLDDDIAETVVNGILEKYFTDKQGNPPRWGPQQGGMQPQSQGPVFQTTFGTQGESEASPGPQQPVPLHRQQPAQSPQHQPAQQPQPQSGGSQPPQGYITRRIPMRDADGKILKDEDGQVIYEEIQIPMDKADQVGTGDKGGGGESELEKMAMRILEKKMLEGDEEDKGKKMDPGTAQMIKEMQKNNQQTQRMLAQMIKGQEKPDEDESDDGDLTKEEIESMFSEKIDEIERRREMRQKDQTIDQLSQNMEQLSEKHKEALEELRNKEVSTMGPEQQERQWEKDMTEVTADKTKDMLETFQRTGSEASQDMIRNLTTLFNEMKSQGEFTREEQSYRNLVRNLMRQENFSRREAEAKAEELLFGRRRDFTEAAPEPRDEERDKASSGSGKQSEMEQIVVESKRRARGGG